MNDLFSTNVIGVLICGLLMYLGYRIFEDVFGCDPEDDDDFSDVNLDDIKLADNVWHMHSNFWYLHVCNLHDNGLVILTKKKGTDEDMLVYINPVVFTRENKRKLRAIEAECGVKMGLIINPQDMHHYQLPDAEKFFPEAKIYVGSERCIRMQNGSFTATICDQHNPVIPELNDDFVLVPWLDWTWANMPPRPGNDPKNNPRIEFLVFHKPSEILYCTDHFQPPIIMNGWKVWDPNYPGFHMIDEKAAKTSVQKVLDLNAKRVVCTHGSLKYCIHDTRDPEVLKGAYKGLLDKY